MSVNFSPCVLIPYYNHGVMMPGVLARLKPFNLPCIVVDNGGDATTQQQLDNLVAEQSGVTLIRLVENTNKGTAVMRGLQATADAGFSHAVQVDADGQHAVEDIPKLLALAEQHPVVLISGQPIYDDSVPRSRLCGRWVTHVWVWIETLPLQLKDSMYGSRVYPVAPMLQLAKYATIGKRMDFGTKVVVHLYWQGNTSYFVPTRVTYPQSGFSYFDALKDSVRISLMHTRLLFGMLPRILSLLMRRSSSHWARQSEAKGSWGVRLMLLVWRLLGGTAFSALLYPVMGVCQLIAARAHKASQDWLARVRQYQPQATKLNSYQHFLRFDNAMLGKIAGWRGELQLGYGMLLAPGAKAAPDVRDPRSKLLLASHLGDVKVYRALAEIQDYKIINALVFSENAQRFKQIIQEMAPQAGINLMPVADIGPGTAILLKEKLDNGEWVVIVDDRIAVTPQRGGDWCIYWSPFMGQSAPFPQGPLILASILRCPVNLIFALHQRGKLHIHCEAFTDPLLLSRGERQQALQNAIDHYAARLEHYALQSPLDWLDFLDFWQLPEIQDKE